jgi:hypothetical protein
MEKPLTERWGVSHNTTGKSKNESEAMPNNNPLPKKKFKHNPFDTKGKGIHTYEPIGFVTDEGEVLINEETVWIPTCYGGKELDEEELTYALMSNSSYDFFMKLLGMKIGKMDSPHRECADCAVVNAQMWLDMTDIMSVEEIFHELDRDEEEED